MRSKVLLTANILSTLWGGSLLIYFCSFLVDGGWDALVYSNILANTFYELIGNSLNSVVVINVIFSLILVHIMLFVLGFLLGWIGFGFKKSRLCQSSSSSLFVCNYPFSCFYLFRTTVNNFRICGV